MPSIRILGGAYKQKTIKSPPHPGLRPTSHRMRQMAFDILLHRFYMDRIGQDLPFSGMRILDLCAGLGGYGFEALSRGADHVTFVEKSIPLNQQLKQVALSWGAIDRIFTWSESWPITFPLNHLPYDILFLDPPYHYRDKILENMISACSPWMTSNGILMVETDHNLQDFQNLNLKFFRNLGTKHLSFFKKIGA